MMMILGMGSYFSYKLQEEKMIRTRKERRNVFCMSMIDPVQIRVGIGHKNTYPAGFFFAHIILCVVYNLCGQTY